MGSITTEKVSQAAAVGSLDFDVVVIGAGISGINAAYRVKTQTPNLTYTVLEARDDVGGTWGFFKYPGIRSDSDLHTFGFPWRPWPGNNTIADGDSIWRYIRDSAAEAGIDKKIRFKHNLTLASFSSKQQRWELSVDTPQGPKTFHAGYVVFGSGYYDYHNPLPAVIPGIQNFKGTTVHPQFWPEDLDYSGKNVVIIGSGATSITLLPAMTDKAKKVTQLQRSPSYIMNLPQVDTVHYWAHKFLPSWLAFQIVRFKFLTLPFIFFKFCRAYPRLAKGIMRRLTVMQLPKNIKWDPHFNPKYYPWEQRLCVVPNGDFYKALKSGKADMVTGHIEQVREKDILMQDGTVVPADIIVTATGLKIQLAGGAKLQVDGKELNPGDKYLWKGLMLQDLPNAAFVIGYTNASWTLGADATAQMVTRVLKYMQARKYGVVVPRVTADDESSMSNTPSLNLNSTYIKAAASVLPKVGDRGPWKARSDYFTDLWNAKYAKLEDGLEFTRETARL